MSTLLNWQCFTLLFCGIYINIAQTSHEQLENQKFSFFFKQKKNLQTARTLRLSKHYNNSPASLSTAHAI
jgi:hypothetical protein